MTNVRRWWVGGAVAFLPVLSLLAAPEQSPQPTSTQAPPAQTTGAPGRGRGAANAQTDAGIPVTNAEVQDACGACHQRDDKDRMTRISYRRATPENWELTIRRMIALNGVQLTPEVARRIIKYLSDSHGLAPEEARPAQFEAERRLVDFTYTADRVTANLCTQCHSMGRVISERRTSDEWTGLMEMHRYYYPEAAAFRSTGRGGGGGGGGGGGAGGGGAGVDGAGAAAGGGGGGDAGDAGGGGAGAAAGGGGGGAARGAQGGQAAPGAQAGGGGGGRGGNNQLPAVQTHLARAFPLVTREWASWSAAMRTPRLAGRWTVAGHALGKGPIYGQVVITAQPDAPDAFVTEARFVYARTGQAVTRRSRAIVYTGFQWRARSADGPADPGTWREVAFIERNGQEMTGRWFTGAHDETGIDVTLHRVANDPIVTGTDVSALKTGSTSTRVRIYGANLPEKISAADIDFGQGVTVARVVAATPEVLTVEVAVAADARVGPRDVALINAAKPAALVVYAKIDSIKVLPSAGMARVGGAAMPARPEQFEARALSHGPDGKPDTPDDLDLGPVEPQWSLEEYTATYRDDDIKFVGELGPGGLFQPNVDGPNPRRSGNRNNVGDVWVIATYSPAGAEPSAKPLRGRAHLLVTVPVYLNWAPREVGR